VVFEGRFEEEGLKITRQHRIFEESANGVRKPLNRLNEIEFVKGKLFANVWQRNDIYEIDLKNDQITR
jgi:glutamine cyclotransferase